MGEDRTSWLRAHAWLAYLLGMAIAATCYVAGHAGHTWLNSGPVFNLIGASAVVAVVTGARMNAVDRRLPWYLIALGQALFVIGDVLAYNYKRLFGVALPFPSVADVFYLAVPPLLITGLVLLIRRRNPRRDRASLIDAVVVAAAAAVVSWVYLIAPYADDHTLGVTTKLVSVAYPMTDIVVLGVAVRLAVGAGRRGTAFRLMLAGIGALLVTDSIYGWLLLHGGYKTGALLDVGWVVFYAMLGAAALHPSMRRLSEPGPDPNQELTRRRLVALAAIALAGPTLIALRQLQGQAVDTTLLICVSALLFVLVLARAVGLVRLNEDARRRERSLRAGGEALVAATTRDQIVATAVTSGRALLGDEAAVRAYLLDDAGTMLVASAATDADALSLPAVAWGAIPNLAGSQAIDHAVARIDTATTRAALAIPDAHAAAAALFTGGELCGVLVAVTAERLGYAEGEAISTLAAQVTLALGAAALAEQAVLRRSDARLSSLVKHASDVICAVDADMRIRYVSPAVEQVLGRTPEALAGAPLTDLVHLADTERVRHFVATVAAQPLQRSAPLEFRMLHSRAGWRDVEAFATNLLADENVSGIVFNIRDISERKAFERQLEHQAFHDILTGLPNSALFRDRLTHALTGRRREQRAPAILLLDVDNLKAINDSLGHAAGDEVLREVASRLATCLRGADTAARLGGDEFAILLEQGGEAWRGVKVAQRILDAIARPFAVSDRELRVNASVGIADTDVKAGEHATDALLRNADVALYFAKEQGKARYQVFAPAMHQRELERLEMTSDLQRALVADEFVLHYQPLMRLASGQIVGVEALVRWQHPKRGLILPGEFVPLAEDTGLIAQLGRGILEAACQQAASLQAACPSDPPLTMSVNLSARQLQSAELIDDVRGALQRSGIPAESLILELTESMMMADVALGIRRLRELRDLGVRLAIDDFGTGYSSLNYIRQFPVDVLKIDRSFIWDASTSPEVEALIAAIVEFARILGLETVAEGIENPEQAQQAQQLHCTLGQGYLFAKPMPAEEVQAMIEGHADRQAALEPEPASNGAARTALVGVGH